MTTISMKHSTCITNKENAGVTSMASTSAILACAFVYNHYQILVCFVIVCTDSKGSDTSNSNVTRVESSIVEI